MRGEHDEASTVEFVLPGSSPHARGTPGSDGVELGHLGIIPACAGNTDWGRACRRGVRDHPRMRGEHGRRIRDSSYAMGSSPHARGTHVEGDVGDGIAGIIPACAGNTKLQALPVAQVRDHPRMRGEHAAMPLHCDEMTGSSPHARGTLRQTRHLTDQGGIIPACAGNTRRARDICRGRWDHPRMRGEHCIA